MNDEMLINTLIIMAGVESKQAGAMPLEDNPLFVAAEKLKELEVLRAQVKQLQAENKGLLGANSKLSHKKDQQGYINSLEAALDCLQFATFLELDDHEMPNLKSALLDSMNIRDNLGDDANQLRQAAKGE